MIGGSEKRHASRRWRSDGRRNTSRLILIGSHRRYQLTDLVVCHRAASSRTGSHVGDLYRVSVTKAERYESILDAETVRAGAGPNRNRSSGCVFLDHIARYQINPVDTLTDPSSLFAPEPPMTLSNSKTHYSKHRTMRCRAVIEESVVTL